MRSKKEAEQIVTPAAECEISWWKPLRKSKRPLHHLASYALRDRPQEPECASSPQFVSCWMPMIALPVAGVFNRPDKIILLATDSKPNNAPAYKFRSGKDAARAMPHGTRFMREENAVYTPRTASLFMSCSEGFKIVRGQLASENSSQLRSVVSMNGEHVPTERPPCPQTSRLFPQFVDNKNRLRQTAAAQCVRCQACRGLAQVCRSIQTNQTDRLRPLM